MMWTSKSIPNEWIVKNKNVRLKILYSYQENHCHAPNKRVASVSSIRAKMSRKNASRLSRIYIVSIEHWGIDYNADVNDCRSGKKYTRHWETLYTLTQDAHVYGTDAQYYLTECVGVYDALGLISKFYRLPRVDATNLIASLQLLKFYFYCTESYYLDYIMYTIFIRSLLED